MLEDVPKDTLQRKYEDSLDAGIQAKLNTLGPSSLYDAISIAHDAEKEMDSIVKHLQPQNSSSRQSSLVSNNRPFKRSLPFPTPRTNNFFTPPTIRPNNVLNGANSKPNNVDFQPQASHTSS